MATTSDTTLPNYYPVSGPNNGDINTGVIPLSNTTFLSVVRQNGGVFAMYARIITIASDGTVTFTSNTLIPIPQSYNIDMILKIAPDKFAMFYDTDSLKTYCIVGQVTGSTISFGASVLFQTGYSTDVYAAASNNNGTFIVQYFGAASTYSTLVQAFTVSGTTISVGGTVALRSSLPRYWNGAFGYDPVGDVFLFNINQDTTPYTINSFALKVTGTTITAGSQQQLFGAPTGGSSQKARLMYNTSLGRFIVVNPYLTASTSRLFSATIASTTITASAQTTDLPFAVPNGFIATSNGSLLLDRNAAGTLYQITVDPANSYKPIATLLPLTGVLTASSTAIGTGGVYAFNTSTGGVQTVTTQAFTTLTTFLGTANETVTTGQPVKVAVTGGGGIATGLSGLTTTTRYYYANDGTVVPSGSASAVANAGVAISATTLLQI
jgi:hypothetical protein